MDGSDISLNLISGSETTVEQLIKQINLVKNPKQIYEINISFY
jgi:hypothetical protein